MLRPTFLVAEPVPGEGISVRKLVLETGYFNVITAYSTDELFETIDRFPLADGVIAHTALEKMDLQKVGGYVRSKMPQAIFIALSHTNNFVSGSADAVISSHEPHALLIFLQERFGNPKPKG